MKYNNLHRAEPPTALIRAVLLATIALLPALTHACPACEKAQPRIFRGLTHGAGPDSRWDYLIVLTAVIVTLLTLYYSIKWLIRPGERAANHIKRFILNND
jgi:hypothetical protein